MILLKTTNPVLRKIHTLLLFLLPVLLSAKGGIYVRVFIDDAEVKPRTFRNEPALNQWLDEQRQSWKAKGYWEASVDSVACGTDTCMVFLHKGEAYTIRHPEQGRQRHGDVPLTLQALEALPQKYVRELENKGYPFARVRLDSLLLNGNSLVYRYRVDTGKLVLIDSFVNHGSSKISRNFIQNYIGIKKGSPYNESRVQNIDRLLAKLPYASVREGTTIIFRDDKADLHFALDKRKVNSFDFLVGFLPNNANSGKILITGEARVHLQNAFKRGEEIFLEWQRLQPNSQRLQVRFAYPYLLNTPLGINTFFMLEKRDSSSLDLNFQLGLPYMVKANNYIKGFFKYMQTIVLVADTNFVKFNRRLPGNLDAVYNQYGVEAYYEKLDYLFSPREGFDLKLTASIGTRKIRENSQITGLSDPFLPDYSYGSLYDSIRRKSVKAELAWSVSYYQPLGKRNVLKLAHSGATVFNQNLLRNELLRIGGSKLLRGFDEISILCSSYALSTLEYRFMLQRNSYFSAFFDWAFIQRKFEGQRFHDFPLGFGAGINLETKIGIFGLTYALGRQQDQPISFRNSKLHIGYVALF